MNFTDDLQWKTHISKTISALKNRLFLIMRLKNKLASKSVKRIADSIFNSKLRYGIQLCGKVRIQDNDPCQGYLEDLQKIQNKMFRLLNNSRIKDKIRTKTISQELEMLSFNQINAQTKLTEIWQALNVENYPIKGEVHSKSKENRTRSNTRGDLVVQGKSEIYRSAFINDASKLWNNAPKTIKDCRTILSAKREIKKYITTLPF